MGLFTKEIEDLKRFEEIVKILSEEGFGLVINRLNLGDKLPLHKKARSKKDDIPPPERVRRTFEKLGPTFIKFGQILAQRPDIVPEEYVEELEKLEDSVPAFESEKAREIVEEELGPIDEVFESFEDEPLAAASIAQVHRATLHNGDDVVVKIRRPGIKEQIRKDLEILEFMAKEGEKHVSKLDTIDAYKSVKEFSEWTKDELNLKKEGRNATILKNNLSEEERVKIPDIYTDLTTEKILVMEYVDGVKCDDKEALEELEIESEEVARTAVRAGLKQTVRDGFFHADPHPSNFFISEEGKIIYLDFGMIGKLSMTTRRNLGLLLLHASNEEVEAAMDVVKRMAKVEEDADLQGLKNDIEESILMIRNSTLEEQSITKALFDITKKAAERGVHMPSSLVILGKSMLTVEGIGLTIYPEFEMTDEFEKITERLLWEMNSPKKLFKTFMIDLVQNRDLVARMPSQVNKALDSSGKGGETTVEVETGPDRMTILAAVLILTSSFFLLQSLPQEQMLLVGALEIILAAYILLR
ncbi:MAG: AarF/ABC1/UbiB kinase family protein [Candidatus Nanohaloarchaeota archaeon QJJ-7]|nr:AarF/ABC1/UbiB kinase family protein [Candidatus Nanohaloarchaeota archaeon QJJ-7]